LQPPNQSKAFNHCKLLSSNHPPPPPPPQVIKHPKMPSAKYTPDCSQCYLSLGRQIWYIPNPHLSSSSFISAISHTYLPNMLDTTTASDPLDLWALNRISFERISLDYFEFIGLLIFSLTTDAS
jgi:hypothetical protein